VAFLVDITEHISIVNELTSICRELEQRLDRMTIAHKELEMLSTKLAQVRSMDLALEAEG
jgi:HPt (histidine-containing phosphotransfer) domain-containing protein